MPIQENLLVAQPELSVVDGDGHDVDGHPPNGSQTPCCEEMLTIRPRMPSGPPAPSCTGGDGQSISLLTTGHMPALILALAILQPAHVLLDCSTPPALPASCHRSMHAHAPAHTNITAHRTPTHTHHTSWRGHAELDANTMCGMLDAKGAAACLPGIAG